MARKTPPLPWADYAHLLGLELSRRRTALGLTQNAIANRAGMTRATYQSYEYGTNRADGPSNPSLLHLLALAEALNTTIGELLPQPVPSLTDGA